MIKTGRRIRPAGISMQGPLIILAWILTLTLFHLPDTAAAADEISFTAEVDQRQISMDDTVVLTLIVSSKSTARPGEPQFNAPDFRIENESSAISVSSQYDSTVGHFSTLNEQQLTKVLRPLKAGKLMISGIQLNSGGKILRAPDITIQVLNSGSPRSQNTPPSGSASGSPSLRFRREKKNSDENVIIRAEVENERVYKGQQILVSYYLYHQTKVFNLQLDRFPTLSGFLREDLEMPVMGQRLGSEQVTLKGVPYERSLLARYAAYPLQEGQLKIDSLALKYFYYQNSRGNQWEDEDPFYGFFQQLSPHQGRAESAPLKIEVLPLPEVGRPESFTGGVGIFNVSSSIDKQAVHANDAVTLTIKVNGRGNVATLQEPKSKWPENIELYDSKGKSQVGSGGTGEKVFEYLLIPRTPGKVTIPPLSFGFFDPEKKQYYVRTTDAIELSVLEPIQGTSLVASNRDRSKKAAPAQNPARPEEVRPLKSPNEPSQVPIRQILWKLLGWIGIGALSLFLAVVLRDSLRNKRKNSDTKGQSRQKTAKNLELLRSLCRNAGEGANLSEVTQAYEILTQIIFDTLDDVFGVSARSVSRDQLSQILLEERLLSPDLWSRIVGLLEFAERVRFASSVGAISEAAARNELPRWVTEGEVLVATLESHADR